MPVRTRWRMAAWLLMVGVCPLAGAEPWPSWRGPQNNGVSSETGLAESWSTTENVAWKLPMPGQAGATPVVWGDRMFVVSAADKDILLLCIDTTTGQEVWRRTVGTGNNQVMRGEGNSASPSPSTDGEHVWAFAGTGDLVCFDYAGNEVWRMDVQKKYGQFDIQFGMTSSPLLDGDRLYLQLLHSASKKIVALHSKTGDEAWVHVRQSDAYAENEHAYTSPMLYRDGEREFLVTHGADYVIAHRLTDGSEIWRCGGINPQGAGYNEYLRFVASPVVTPGLIVVPTAKNGPVLALRPDATGDITAEAAAHAWKFPDNTPDVPSPLVHDGLVYLCRENGVLLCLDAATGEEQYKSRLHSDVYRGSPVYGDGRVYVASRDGTVSVVAAGRKFAKLAEISMGEPISSSPVISEGTIFLRTYENLYAIRPAQ